MGSEVTTRPVGLRPGWEINRDSLFTMFWSLLALPSVETQAFPKVYQLRRLAPGE